jgi:hypothetical protein
MQDAARCFLSRENTGALVATSASNCFGRDRAMLQIPFVLQIREPQTPSCLTGSAGPYYGRHTSVYTEKQTQMRAVNDD